MKTGNPSKTNVTVISTAKVLSVVLVIMMVVQLFGIIAYAVGPQLVVSGPPGTVYPGDTFDLVVSIGDNPGIAGLVLEVSYDDTCFSFESVEQGQVLIDAELTPVSYAGAPDGYSRVKTLALGTTNFTGNGVLFTVSFAIEPDVSGVFDFTVTYKNNDIVNSGRQTVSLSVIGTQVIVGEYKAGVSVTGVVKSYNPKLTTSLRLFNNDREYQTVIDEAPGSGQVSQPFKFDYIEPGTYTLEIKKATHTDFIVHRVIVDSEDIDLARDSRITDGVMTLRCGDINGDGSINSADLNILWSSVNYLKSVDDPGVNKKADLNGDGSINSADLNILWSSVNYLKGEVVID